MINRFEDFNSVQPYKGVVTLPRGGYVCTIIGAKLEDNEFGGQTIKVAFDIAEGEYSGYYKAKFDASTNENKKWPGVYNLNVPLDDGSERDGWTKRRFKTFTNALEDSNAGYHFDWDESKFKGKKIGIVFNWREYEYNDYRGMIASAAKCVSVDDIRNGNFKVPADRMLKTKQPAETVPGFVNVPEGEDSELPF